MLRTAEELDDCMQQVKQLQTGNRSPLFAIIDDAPRPAARVVTSERQEASSLDFEDDFEIIDVANEPL